MGIYVTCTKEPNKTNGSIYDLCDRRGTGLGTGTGLEVHEGMRAANTINKHKFLCAAVLFEGSPSSSGGIENSLDLGKIGNSCVSLFYS